jgi:hypothetical protein
MDSLLVDKKFLKKLIFLYCTHRWAV